MVNILSFYFDQYLHILYYHIIVYCFSFWYLVKESFFKLREPSNIYNDQNLVALITGGGTGIGLQTSKQLLEKGHTVIIAGIYEDQKAGILSLKKDFGEKNVRFLPCDLSSLDSVRKSYTEFQKFKLSLNILVNNAGIMFAPYSKTVDGYEKHWSVNYLGPFLLSHLFMGTLRDSSTPSTPSRIVNVSSCLHYMGTINFDDIEKQKRYSAEAAYCQSKLAMVMFGKTLNKKLQETSNCILVNAVHPAISFTGLYAHVWWAKVIPDFAQKVLQPTTKGCLTSVHVALSRDVTSGGNYYESCEKKEAAEEASNSLLQEMLWNMSCRQAGIKIFGQHHVLSSSGH